MGKLWGGRFSGEQAGLLDEFNASLPFDKELYAEDIEGSIAHARMQQRQGMLAAKEADAICDGLIKVKEEIDSGSFIFNIADEDIHMAVEKRLTEIIGDVAKKLHTGRSRNDQVATDFRLYVRKQNHLVMQLIESLVNSLLELSRPHTQTLLPGMTHLQHAQPVSLAYHLLAYVAMLQRDHERFASSTARHNRSPLGCAALAGTPHPIDREMSAKSLGFDGPTVNCLDAVSDRDFALEALFNVSMLMMHISRFAEEFILWSSYEFKFITIDDAYATGSSIMPQKKNPDVPELLRGKTGRVYGNLMSLLTVMKGLPLAYNKDTQEDKEGVFDSFQTANISLEILAEVVKTLKVHPENMLKAAKTGHLSATDLADYLVRACDVPFREAHHITGRAVAEAEKLGKDISEMSAEELMHVDERIQADAAEYLGLERSMEARESQGGTASSQVQKQLAYFESWLKEVRS